MGVTTYYSVGGEIIGERSSGVRTDYLRDALGSVIATKRTDRSTISNAYRYKPYGERLAKTGVAADPRFQWVGTAGYRETAISHSNSYVRARHLGQEEGRWTTVDPLWPSEIGFAFVVGKVTTSTDPVLMSASDSAKYCADANSGRL